MEGGWVRCRRVFRDRLQLDSLFFRLCPGYGRRRLTEITPHLSIFLYPSLHFLGFASMSEIILNQMYSDDIAFFAAGFIFSIGSAIIHSLRQYLATIEIYNQRRSRVKDTMEATVMSSANRTTQESICFNRIFLCILHCPNRTLMALQWCLVRQPTINIIGSGKDTNPGQTRDINRSLLPIPDSIVPILH